MDKQHIINEIRRTAKNGKASGQRLFLKETGIKENDWRGKYWARWGDALIEAGYSQNDWNPAYSELHLLTSVLDLVRKLNKYPTRSEMDLERRSNPNFPSSKPILHAASKAGWIDTLLEHCRNHGGYRDVEQILQATSVTTKSTAPSKVTTDTNQAGSVYLILAGNHYKIGFTTALYRRASQIANGHPNGAELIHSFETDDARGIEAYWHDRFSDRRVKGVNVASGEWFSLSKSDVAAFCKRKRFM